LQQDQDLSTVEDEGIFHLDSQQELHEMDQLYEQNLYTPSLEINEENHCLSKRKRKVLSPLSENEINQLLNGQVTAQVNEICSVHMVKKVKVELLPLVKMMIVL